MNLMLKAKAKKQQEDIEKAFQSQKIEDENNKLALVASQIQENKENIVSQNEESKIEIS